MTTSSTAASPGDQGRSKILFSLQVLRGVAASLVLVRHAAKESFHAGAFEVGQAGVDVFFVVSGIVIYLTGRNLSWDAFVRRRIARIVPLYWIILCISLAASLLATGAYQSHGGFSWSNTLLSYFFIPAFDENGRVFPPIVAGWSLNFEAYFYLVCTLVLLLLPRAWFLQAVSTVILAGVVIGSTFLWHDAHNPDIAFAPSVLLLPISIEFLAGLWLARLWLSGFRTPGWVNLLLILAALAWLAMAPGCHPYTPWRPLAWGIPAAAIVWAVIASEERIAFAKWRPALLVGDSSYALYLSHPVGLAIEVAIMRKLHLDLSAPVQLAIMTVTCLLGGVLIHLIVERKLVEWANALLGLQKSTSAAALQSAQAAKI